MQSKHLNRILSAVIVSASLQQVGCYGIAMSSGGGCEVEEATGWFPAESVDFVKNSYSLGNRFIGNCDELCSDLGFSYYSPFCYDTGNERGDADSLELEVKCSYEYCTSAGRRPEGLRPLSPIPGKEELDLCPEGMFDDKEHSRKWLRRTAFLEKSAVFAFAQLKRELKALGAPKHLIKAAERARRDEIRHAKVITRMAQAYGVDSPDPQVNASPTVRRMLDIAKENAVEGCVHETFGSLIAQFQASRATDSRFRAIAKPIAEDETRHAAFSWQLHHWLMKQLSKSEQSEVMAAQRTARATMAKLIRGDLTSAPLSGLGLPSQNEGLALWNELDVRLFIG